MRAKHYSHRSCSVPDTSLKIEYFTHYFQKKGVKCTNIYRDKNMVELVMEMTFSACLNYVITQAKQTLYFYFDVLFRRMKKSDPWCSGYHLIGIHSCHKSRSGKFVKPFEIRKGKWQSCSHNSVLHFRCSKHV